MESKVVLSKNEEEEKEKLRNQGNEIVKTELLAEENKVGEEIEPKKAIYYKPTDENNSQ